MHLKLAKPRHKVLGVSAAQKRHLICIVYSQHLMNVKCLKNHFHAPLFPLSFMFAWQAPPWNIYQQQKVQSTMKCIWNTSFLRGALLLSAEAEIETDKPYSRRDCEDKIWYQKAARPKAEAWEESKPGQSQVQILQEGWQKLMWAGILQNPVPMGQS